MSLPPFPKYVGNPYDDNQHPRTPNDIPREQAIQRGTFLLSLIPLWLRNDGSYRTFIEAYNPPQGWSMSEEMIGQIVSYFDSETGKEWLGREFYLIQGGNAPWPGNLNHTSPIVMDDIPIFFNWLFRIPNSQHIPHNEDSPLTFENDLQVQAGGRRRKRNVHKTRKGRKTRLRKN